jgi:phosphoribosyl 1,2-cyclic phosphodiesterase
VRFLPLGSGSSGNATLVEFDSTRFLVDAGLSARGLAQRLQAAGLSPRSVDWILLSHEHQDHCRGAQRFSVQHGVPVICSHATLEAMDRSPRHFADWIALPEDRPLDLGPVQVDAFPVPHDAARPVGFVIHGDGLRIGLATDLGHATTLTLHRLRGCHLLMIESNYDPGLLQRGPYPWQLKQRVSSRTGHLSNQQAAAVLQQTVDDECRAVVMAHLSEQNNRPGLVRQLAANSLSSSGRNRVALRVAAARRPTPPVHL